MNLAQQYNRKRREYNTVELTKFQFDEIYRNRYSLDFMKHDVYRVHHRIRNLFLEHYLSGTFKVFYLTPQQIYSVDRPFLLWPLEVGQSNPVIELMTLMPLIKLPESSRAVSLPACRSDIRFFPKGIRIRYYLDEAYHPARRYSDSPIFVTWMVYQRPLDYRFGIGES